MRNAHSTLGHTETDSSTSDKPDTSEDSGNDSEKKCRTIVTNATCTIVTNATFTLCPRRPRQSRFRPP